MTRWIVFAAAGLALVATAPAAEAQKKDRYLITAEEIAERQDLVHAYDAVRMLRSQWLKPARPRGDLGPGAMGTSPYRPKSGSRPSVTPGEQQDNVASANAARDEARARAGQEKKQIQAVVYIDEIRQPDLEEALRSVRVGEIVEIGYMNATQALARFGAGHDAGAILVKTKRLPQ